ncbi:MAG: aminodeoxychorismate/anthranilate synthase component II [Lachnospiraceae bacterium]|jgi:anthranilate synthase/aminodeoxychorismate synthase-like glutamine amidotransferase|nr:aminodeoxychorismate/anthranilate synthase component II [Lachnospiraceae bacterium]
MFFMLDNFDSFVYNLSACFQELGQEILVRRADEVSLSQIESLKPEGIILSPGPKRPSDAVLSLQIIHKFQGRVPVLGVCLGHQAIAHYYGAQVIKGAKPMHGKVTPIHSRRMGLFAGLPKEYLVTRYHSLTVDPVSMPRVLAVDAVAEDGAVMGISHKRLPLYGVQFHPEAVLTEHGPGLLDNFVRICREWGCSCASNRRA